MDAMAFHSDINSELKYYVKPRMGLKRFIFNRSKDTKIPIDEIAYHSILKILKKKSRTKELMNKYQKNY